MFGTVPENAILNVREELSEMQIGNYNNEAEINQLCINQYSGEDEVRAFKHEFFPQSQQGVQISYPKNYDGKPEEWP